MKIINQKLVKKSKDVGMMPRGAVVQFNRQFHQDYPPNDIYIVLDVCDSYAYQERSTGFKDNKTGVVNLATGKLSFVSESRQVCRMNAEVKVDGPEN